jgi:hypothetical protein
MRQFLKEFSFPGGIGSHCTPETPGSIHEGGELGYSLSHAFGAAFDNPDLLVAVVVGDGEAETGPLATAWHSNKFLNPLRDGAVLPVLHLNGYKIDNPTILARIPPQELEALFRGYGWTPYFVEGDDPMQMHEQMAATMERCIGDIHAIQAEARTTGRALRARWPMIVLRSPKGWTGPAMVAGHAVEGYWRSHQVPLADVRDNAQSLKLLEQWLLSYRPHELFDASGRLMPELRALAPQGLRRMSANPHANGGALRKALRLPDFRDYALEVRQPAGSFAGNTRRLGAFLRDVLRLNPHNFRVFGPDETTSNKLQAVYEASGENVARRLPAGGCRRRPLVARRARDGDAVRAHARRMARGLPAHWQARLLLELRSVRARHRLDVQPARQVARDLAQHRLARPGLVAEPVDHFNRLAPGPQWLHSPGSRLPRRRREQEPRRHSHLPATGFELPAGGGGPLLAQHRQHQRHRVRQAGAPAIPDHGRSDQSLHQGHRPLAMGQ